MPNKPTLRKRFENVVSILAIIAGIVSIGIFVVQLNDIPLKTTLLSGDLVIAILGAVVGSVLSYWLSRATHGKPKATVFVSSASKDLGFTNRLTQELISNDFKILKVDDVLPGENLREKISSKIEKSDLFLVVLSQNYVSSQWYKQELDIASKYNKKVLPLLIDKIEVPRELESLVYADFTSNYATGFDALLKSLKAQSEPAK